MMRNNVGLLFGSGWNRTQKIVFLLATTVCISGFGWQCYDQVEKFFKVTIILIRKIMIKSFSIFLIARLLLADSGTWPHWLCMLRVSLVLYTIVPLIDLNNVI